MIVSHEHRFVFVRTRKTASTSIEIALSTMLGVDAVITTMSPRDERLRLEAGGRPPQNHLRPGHPAVSAPGPGDGVEFYNHMPAAAIRAKLGDSVWRRYFTFCFERNPWDKAVSLYFHRHRTEPRLPFQQFVRSGEAADTLNWPLYTVDGRVCVDLVGQYETLEADLRRALAEATVGPPPDLPRAKAHFRPRQAHYRDVIDEESRHLLDEIFAKEISHHGYTW